MQRLSASHCLSFREILSLSISIIFLLGPSSNHIYNAVADASSSSFKFLERRRLSEPTPIAFTPYTHKTSTSSYFFDKKFAGIGRHRESLQDLVILRGGSSSSDSENEEDVENEEEYTATLEEDEEQLETIAVEEEIENEEECTTLEEDEEQLETIAVGENEEEDENSSTETKNIDFWEEGNDGDSNSISSDIGSRRKIPRKGNRHTSDIILKLDRRSSVLGNDESLALRHMITSRTSAYFNELQEEALLYSEQQLEDSGSKAKKHPKLPHPRRLLHSLAKKVPAIKQSPDVNLRIHSSRADIDPGVAACIIGRLAFACEQYEQVQTKLINEYGDNANDGYDDEDDDADNSSEKDSSNNGSSESKNKNKSESAAPQITMDRRFEQLVECVISGVNIKKRKEESLERQISKSTDEINTDIEEILDEEDNCFDEGLNVRDACRAAWGIAILGAHYLDTLGGVKINDLLLALSLRIRELLLARLQLLRQGDILSSGHGMYHQDYGYGADEDEDGSHQTRQLVTTEDRLNELAEELAEDAASAMWAFGCVKACTGLKSVPLFEACCSILCQDPLDLRRRAQEAEYEPEKHHETIGSSDIVDQLALSEAAEASEEEDDNDSGRTHVEIKNGYESSPGIMNGKDAFIDWLSPVEVTDMLWALALHGSNATSSKDIDEVTLSETASTLRETAYDRLMEWLDDDLSHVSEEHLNQDTSIPKESLEIEEEEDVNVNVVEVVDAAILLSSEAESASSSSASPMKSLDYSEETNSVPTETISMKTSAIVTNDVNIQEVEVVDAAALLASMEGDNQDSIPVKTEVMVAPTSLIEGKAISSDVDISSPSGERKKSQIFTPHDLASISWSVTELRDPLRIHIVGNIIELLWRLGPDGISALSGTDLSNLAWAIAKYEGENHDAYSLSITRWIADEALQRTGKYPLLRIFQPPELGRIMWAIACTASTHASAVQDAIGHETSSFFLTRKALKVAFDQLTLFSTETLVRIAWAHLEINEGNLSALNSFETMALGKILAAAEHSLHRWERVDFSSDIASDESHVESPLFSSFFGRSRRNLDILEQAVNDDNDEDDMALAPLGRIQRPKLRDLMLDPSTLCKAACGFQRLSKEHPYIKGGWTFTRVAVRLLSSKNARLMKECSIHDIVRLCEAAVLSDVDGHGRELIIGLFARQVVKILDNVLENDSLHDTSLHFESASSTEISTLIWTLGEMGVKYSSSKQQPGKKMRLSFADPLLRRIRLKSLDQKALERLIRGLVLMKMTSNQTPFVLEVLTSISEKVLKASKGSDLCSLAEAIGILKEASKNSSTKSIKLKDDFAQSERGDKVDDPGPQTEDIQEQISILSDQMLSSIATRAISFSESLTANEIRRILEVYSLLPFQADEMIECLSDEVSNRLETIHDLRKDQTLVTLLKDGKKKSSVVKNSLFGDFTASIFGSIRSRFLSLFKSSHIDNEEEEEDVVHQIDDEGTMLTEEIKTIIQDLISATSKASKRAKADQSALKLSLDKVVQSLEEGASFELGRSLELIENYHRNEFATGERRSRYDRGRKNYISKRVLSRLLP